MTRIIKSNKILEDILPNSGANLLNLKSYIAETNGVEVTAWPEFIDNQINGLETDNLFIWAYHIRILNKSNYSVQLLNRYWKIIDEKGIIQEVRGEGVIGEQPKILPNQDFQYSSGVHLRYPSGIMTGHYQMQKEDGELFEIKIPTFSLDVPNIKNFILN